MVLLADQARRVALALELERCEPLVRWFHAVAPLASQPDSLAFRTAHAAAARKLGAQGRTPYVAPRGFEDLARPHWTWLDVARWLLVSRGLQAHPEPERAPFVQRLLDSGELGEQASLLRTLWALPGSETFVQTGVSACRTNAVVVFEAIACENPYPAVAFDELAFNQLVIKALFLELDVRRIEGLPERTGDELVRMAEGLASERRAAGRPVPPGIPFIVSRGEP